MSIASGQRRPLLFSNKSEDTPGRSSNGTKKIIRFQMPHSTRLKEVLEKFILKENIREYEQLVCSIRDNVFEDDEIEGVLKEATQCISLLNQDLRLFVEAVLSLKWSQKNERIVNEYRSFVVNLLCAHNYHTKYAIDQLIKNFMEVDKEIEWTNGIPCDEDCQKYANVHSVINILFRVIPMSKEILHQSIISYYPYMKKPTHMHEVFLHNILWILDYQPDFRLEIFYLLFNRLIILDSNLPRDEIIKKQNTEDDIFVFEDEKAPIETVNPLAHTLDVCLDKILNYFVMECYDLDSGQLDWDNTKSLYQTMITVFDKVILPTYNIHHIQYTMFFLCSFKITICEGFLSYLWKKFCDPSVPSIHRQSAVAYIASLLARGAFVPISMLKSTLEQMASWIHKYIPTQDGLECVNSDVRIHSVFYSVCQALFYVVAFRHRDLVNTRKNIAFLESLNLAKMVTCRLNPLRVCQPAILQNFAAVTRTYQLAYCYSIVEHNQRNVIPTVYLDDKGTMVTKSAILDSFFPFDPFFLKRCGSKLSSIYLEYKGSEEEITDKETKMEEDDDFLNEAGVQTPSKNQSNRFSYGTSPGFKYKSYFD